MEQTSGTERGMRRTDGTPRDAVDFMDRTVLALIAAGFVLYLLWLTTAALFSLERAVS